MYAQRKASEAIVPVTRTLAEAFSFYGARAANPRWGWAAQSDDGKTVVITMWKDRIGHDGDAIVYGFPPRPNDRRPGYLDMIKKLRHAQDNCEGLLRTVIVEAVDTKAGTRSTRKKYDADPSLVMKLESLDARTGEFQTRSMARTDA
jgi:hypothetical protein